MPKPIQSEIDAALDICLEYEESGKSNYTGLSYEEGVKDAINWIQGNGSNPFED